MSFNTSRKCSLTSPFLVALCIIVTTFFKTYTTVSAYPILYRLAKKEKKVGVSELETFHDAMKVGNFLKTFFRLHAQSVRRIWISRHEHS